MVTKIFVNLPVRNLPRTIMFFSQLGFSFNPKYTDDQATCMIVSENIFAMLMTQSRFQTFTSKGICDYSKNIETIMTLGVESRADVDKIVGNAFAVGAMPGNPTKDSETAYIRSFYDLDGHLWEVLYIAEG
jgi:uncharacterized protein